MVCPLPAFPTEARRLLIALPGACVGTGMRLGTAEIRSLHAIQPTRDRRIGAPPSILGMPPRASPTASPLDRSFHAASAPLSPAEISGTPHGIPLDGPTRDAAGPPVLLRRLTGGLESLHSLMSPDSLSEFADYDVYRSLYRACEEAAGISEWPPGRQLTYLWLRSIFANYHLSADRLDMAHGVEVRLPFLDRDGLERILDRGPDLSPAAQASLDSLLLVLTSLGVLQERYSISS
jgi:hypothetical protein